MADAARLSEREPRKLRTERRQARRRQLVAKPMDHCALHAGSKLRRTARLCQSPDQDHERGTAGKDVAREGCIEAGVGSGLGLGLGLGLGFGEGKAKCIAEKGDPADSGPEPGWHMSMASECEPEFRA
ncbi:hypothetical protein ANO11243_089700 [Dothideomycetidae sp. 11243]|nr:hypothetical protein ANO11243_089700 [fungal sp. No.11243]